VSHISLYRLGEKHLNIRWVPLALLTAVSGTQAVELPSAGSQLQQIPAVPVPGKQAPDLRIQKSDAPAAGPHAGVQVVVKSLHVVNAHAFPEADLIAATGFTAGKTVTLEDLRGFAAAIANYYREQGYFLAQAVLPPQDIVNGVVTISVVEGQYGKIVVRNDSALKDGVAKDLLRGLGTGDTVTIGPLESRLLQLSDLPGVAVKSTLVPGASAGASDLIVDIHSAERITGSVDVDDAGNRYTGENRTGATLNVNDPLGYGDVISLRGLSSWDGMNYGRVAYQLQVHRADVGVAYTALNYRLGEEFEPLDAHGTAQIASVYGRYPLLRSRAGNLYLQLDIDSKSFHDKIDSAGVLSDKKVNVGMLSLVGDYHDGFAGGGLGTYSFTWTSGKLEFESAQALTADSTTARTEGHYDKFGLTFMRLQRLTQTVSLYAAFQGQLALQNLDISEKLGLGGAQSVRAYPEGESYADEGYILNVEGRVQLPKLAAAIPGLVQAVGFLDTGTGKLNKAPWTPAENTRTLSGGGFGLNWLGDNSFSIKAYYAHKIGGAIATSAPDSDSRAGVSAIKYF